jgi:hypothetical protein
MPFVPARPLSLNHLSDEVASLALDKHLGDFAAAAKELNINRSDLRKLTWHNPRILSAALERMWLFRSGVRSKITAAIYSGSAKRRRWGFDAMFDSYEFRDQWSNPALLMLAPASRRRAKAPKADNVQLVLEREAAAELDRERAAEFEAAERAREAAEIERRQERVAIVVDNRPEAPSRWPAGIRRPTRGRPWR